MAIHNTYFHQKSPINPSEPLGFLNSEKDVLTILLKPTAGFEYLE